MVITATPPTTPVVTPAPTLRNVSLNQTDQAAAFGEVTRKVTPAYQFSHWPRRQAFRRTLSFVWNPSQFWTLPFVTCVSMTPRAMDSCAWDLSELNFAPTKSRAVQFWLAQGRYSVAFTSRVRTAVLR